MNHRIIITATFLSLLSFCSLAQQKPATKPADAKTYKWFFEKTYLHTDRSYYNGGEDIWFSAYLVNGKSTSLTSSSNNLYVELISSNTEIVDRKIIRMDNGLGKGDFKLNDSIPAGWYTIRAYTNWMRNFGDAFVFKKRLYINNNIAVKETGQKVGLKKEQQATVLSPANTIRFFPEGGSLVEGVSSIVAFKTEDETGNGLRFKGKIISSKGDTITAFQSTDAGVGIFAFMPNAGIKYHVEGAYADNKNVNVSLPVPLTKGFVMHIATDSLTFKVAISANEMAFKEFQNKEITLVVKHAGDEYYSGIIKLVKPNIMVSIAKKGLPAGVAMVTLIDDAGRANCERLVYVRGENPVNLVVTADKPSYKPNEKVNLRVKATDVFGQPVKASLSLAAVDGIMPANESSIVSYFLLQSEIKGDIKNADQYFDVNNPLRDKQLDLLLLTQGWREYLWRKLADTSLVWKYMPEPGFTLAGKVREKLANKPLPNMNITLFGSGFNGNRLFTTKTDANGNYYLDGLSWNGNQEIKLSSKDDKGRKGGWLLLDSLPKPIALVVDRGAKAPNPASPQLDVELYKRMDYNRMYKTGDSIRLNDIEIKANKNGKVALFDETLMTFGYPDQVFDITPADYSYKGLEHFLLTKVDGAFPVSEQETQADTGVVSTEGITFISNGQKIRPRIVVNNKEELVSERLDYYSLTMDQINQVRVRHLIGNTGNDVYVISLNLKDSALRGANLDLLNLNLQGYYTARNFYAPSYDHQAVKNKDLRNTIFWAPAVKTNDQGEATVSFFNADSKTNIVVKTEGISDKGMAVANKITYKVQ